MARYLLEMFGVSLLWTLFIEELIGVVWGFREKKYFLLFLLVNVVTNPVAVLSYWLYRVYWVGTSMTVQIVIEVIVVLAEAWIYSMFAKEKEWRIPRPILLAIIANAASWGSGLLI